MIGCCPPKTKHVSENGRRLHSKLSRASHSGLVRLVANEKFVSSNLTARTNFIEGTNCTRSSAGRLKTPFRLPSWSALDLFRRGSSVVRATAYDADVAQCGAAPS